MEKFVISDTSSKPWDIVYIDTRGPFTKSNEGNRYCITMLCELTKYVVSIHVCNKEAETIPFSRTIFTIILYQHTHS